jgi:hypothetical protein
MLWGGLFSGCTTSAGLKKEPVVLEARGSEPERTPIYRHEGWIVARASMHNHTIYSDGCRTPEDLLELARMDGMAILAYNDHQEGKICGGEHELFCVKMNGLSHHGFDVYFDHLRGIQKQAESQGMIALKGIEIIPYIHNYGKFPYMVIDGAQKHFTVYGVEDESIFPGMPTRDYVPLKPEPLPGDTPYAKLVDYIADRGGIVHAVHVGDGADVWYGPAHGAVPPPIHHIHVLKNLTGFSILPSGWGERAGGPGGLWDTALIEYLGGMRNMALWAMGDADYHCEASLAVATTLFYMREFTEDEVYRCLRDGRMVALQGDAFQDVYVAEWWISDTGEPDDPVMLGEEVMVRSAPVVKFALDHPVAETRVRLIRNGVVVLEKEGSEFSFRDDEQGEKKAPAFYRVEVIGPRADRGLYEGPTMPQSELFVNPIFVRFAG